MNTRLMPCDVDDAHLYDAEMRTHILPRDLERGKGSQRERGMMVSAAVASCRPNCQGYGGCALTEP